MFATQVQGSLEQCHPLVGAVPDQARSHRDHGVDGFLQQAQPLHRPQHLVGESGTSHPVAVEHAGPRQVHPDPGQVGIVPVGGIGGEMLLQDGAGRGRATGLVGHQAA